MLGELLDLDDIDEAAELILALGDLSGRDVDKFSKLKLDATLVLVYLADAD